jgi:hypothetical protein
MQVFGPVPIEIFMQPSDVLNQLPGDTIHFMVGVNNVTSFQWQGSTDAGNTFSNLSDGGFYTNTTSQNLQVTIDTSLDNNYYRVICYNNTDSLVSNSALLTVNSISGIADSYINNLSVYPNPADNFIFISDDKGGELLIFNTKGILVKQVEAGLNKTEIDISCFENGLYLLKFIDNKGKTRMTKLIIR